MSAPPDVAIIGGGIIGLTSALFLAKEGLSKFDMPEYFLRMSAFPLTASGKILKRELVEWAKAGKIAPQPCRWVAADKRSA